MLTNEPIVVSPDEDAALVLWCLEGAADIGRAGRCDRLCAGQAVVVPSGASSAVQLDEGALVYPVTLPVAQGMRGPESVGAAPAFPVSAELQKILLRSRGVVDEHDDERRDTPVIIWCVAGAAQVTGCDTTDPLSLGESEALCVPAGTPHRVRGDDDESVVLRIPIPASAAPEGLTVFRVDHALARALHAQNLSATTELAPRGWDERELDRVMTESFAARIRPEDRRCDRVACVMRRLLADPGDCTPASELAKTVGVSVRCLERDFASEAGESLRAWRSRLRMSAAADALRAGERPARVSARLGFAYPSAFTRAFVRHYDVAPSAFAPEAVSS